MSTIIQQNWFTNHENLTNLVKYIVEKDGQESIDIVCFMEKPWKWEKEWEACLHNIEIDKGLDAFDRRDK